MRNFTYNQISLKACINKLKEQMYKHKVNMKGMVLWFVMPLKSEESLIFQKNISPPSLTLKMGTISSYEKSGFF